MEPHKQIVKKQKPSLFSWSDILPHSRLVSFIMYSSWNIYFYFYWYNLWLNLYLFRFSLINSIYELVNNKLAS